MGGLLDQKVALVTGAGSGIGRASALRFAREGAAVAVVDLGARRAQRCVDEIEQAGGRAISIVADIGDGTQVEAMIATTVDAFGRLDVLHNNAATTRPGTAVELSLDDWNTIWNTNVTAQFLAAKFAIPHMTDRGGGSIIATASVSALAADAGQVGYVATKAAVISLTRALAVDHAAVGVRANCICPGITRTPPMVASLEELSLLDAAVSAQPLGRLAEPEEIAAAALWLASDESSFVTGQAIVVDGGLTARTHFAAMQDLLSP